MHVIGKPEWNGDAKYRSVCIRVYKCASMHTIALSSSEKCIAMEFQAYSLEYIIIYMKKIERTVCVCRYDNIIINIMTLNI